MKSFIEIFLKWNFIVIMLITIIAAMFYLIKTPLPNFEAEKCPLCFGNNFCSELVNVHMDHVNLTEKFYNFFNVKNTHFAFYHNEPIVLKKLAHENEWDDFDMTVRDSCDQILTYHDVEISRIDQITSNIEEIIDFEFKNNNKLINFCDNFTLKKKLKSEINHNNKHLKNCHKDGGVSKLNENGFEYCDKKIQVDNPLFDVIKLLEFKMMENFDETVESYRFCNINITRFIENMKHTISEAHLWVILQVNLEPVILTLLDSKQGWPVPKYLGACGRYIAVENGGLSLTDFTNVGWFSRAEIALQLLQSAIMFTQSHPIYRFYLTDLSSDNIVVNDLNRIKFVDLENVILTEKNDKFESDNWHVSEHFSGDEITLEFSSKDICSHPISDHNYYNFCKLLLWSKAPYPMVNGGLLHSMPSILQAEYPEIFGLIDACVSPTNATTRFDVVKILINQLEVILSHKQDYY